MGNRSQKEDNKEYQENFPDPLLLPEDTCILACRAMAPELTALGIRTHQLYLLDQELHRYPERLNFEIARTLGELELKKEINRAILVYGYCGGGLEGITTQRIELVIPLIHDCIPLLTGNSQTGETPAIGGGFYLSPGWIEHGLTPYTEFFSTCERFGQEDAMWICQEMLKSYTEVVLVETVAGITDKHRRYAVDMAKLFGLSYREIKGREKMLRDLITVRLGANILSIRPGETIRADLFR